MLRSTLLLLTLAGPVCGHEVWNIVNHGAEPGADVADIINEGLRTQHEHGLPVYIPHGRWGVASTIEAPKRDGGALLGDGAAGVTANDALRGLGSILEWWGEPDQPMVRMTGSRWRIENLALSGKPFRSDRPRASIGMLITKVGRGLGPGKHEFRNVWIASCEVGIQCGKTAGEHNNDLLGFERLVFSHCGVAYRVINSQAMSHWFDRLEIRNTPIGFQFYGGGMLHAQRVLTFKTTLLDIRKNDPPQFSPGLNNAVFKFEELKVDAQHRGEFCLVTTHDDSRAQVVLESAMISGPSPFTLARLGAGMQLVLRDVTSPTRRATIEKAEGAEVISQNVRVEGLPRNTPPSP